MPVGGASIDLLVGYDHAYIINALHAISTSTNCDEHPSAAFSRLCWTIFGGMVPQPRPVITNRAEINHVQRLVEDDIKALFYSDVAGVKLTTVCACSDKELAEAKFLIHARRTTEITQEGRVRASMSWRDGYPEVLSFNMEKTVSRMYQQENSLRRKGRLEEYNKEIRDLLTQGFVRPLTEAESNDGRGWYLDTTPSTERTRPARRSVSCVTPPHSSRVCRSMTVFTKDLTYSTTSSPVSSHGVAIELLSWET